MNSKKWWLAGLGAACVACSAIPLLGGAAIGVGAAELSFNSGWGGIGLLAVGAVVAGAITLRPGRAVQACAASSGCRCKPPARGNTEELGADEKPPIACTLTGDDFAQRTAWIRQLAEKHLVSVTRTPLSLRLTYAPAASAQVKELVRTEQACCAFLQFDLREGKNGVILMVTAPEEARETVDLLFDHFAPDAARYTPSSSSEASR